VRAVLPATEADGPGGDTDGAGGVVGGPCGSHPANVSVAMTALTHGVDARDMASYRTAGALRDWRKATKASSSSGFSVAANPGMFRPPFEMRMTI
jgi:hypothetical protein